VAREITRGDIWTYEFAPPDKRRPVLVLTRQGVIRFLRTVMVAPITSTIRGLPSEVMIGIDDGLKRDCAVNLDHVQTVAKDRLRSYIGHLDREKMRAVCRALNTAASCDE